MTPEQLAEIVRREQTATPGPWRTHDAYVPAGGYCATVLSGDGNDVEPRAWLPTFSNDTGSPMARNVEADADFMAHARQDVPALLAYVAELEAELAPGAPVTDVVQLVIPRGPMLEGLLNVLRALNCTMAGPLPLDREPIPTYVLQPLDIKEPKP